LEDINGSRKTFKIKGNTPLYIAILCLIILCGCAKKDVLKSVPDEAELRERIVRYWNHKVNEEFDKSYTYEDPIYRKKISMTKYIQTINTSIVKWMGADIEKIRLEDDVAYVDIKLKIRVMANPSQYKDVYVPEKEKWIWVDGVWYNSPQRN
jgi:hypothetical protein